MLKRHLHHFLGAALMALSCIGSATEASVPESAVAQAPNTPVAPPADDKAADDKAVPKAAPDAKLADNEPNGTVRVVGIQTDVGKRYGHLVPNLPIPPFKGWHQWMKDHEIATHCGFEWKDNKGRWWFAEIRSAKWDPSSNNNRVGLGQFPGTGYNAYGVYITQGRMPREIDLHGRPIVVTCDVAVKCDFRQVEWEVRKYGAFGKQPGDRGTRGDGSENVGLGGPAYKPAQNSNSMVNYVLRKCGVTMAAPELATGWDTEPYFPHSTDSRFPKYENQP